MKRSYFLLFTVYSLLFSVFLWGCGSGTGSPGSSGSEDTGIRIKAVSITRESPDIDVYSESVITREDATLTIESEKLNPGSSFDPFPASIEECTITYKKAIEDPSAPMIESLTIYPNCTMGGCVATCPESCTVTLIDISRKQTYWNAIGQATNVPEEYPTHYIAEYNCKYMNNLDKTGYFKTEYDMWLADFVD